MAYLLIVDDDEDFALAAAHVLRAGGHEVATELDTRSAVRSVERRAPDVAILDVMFPENQSAGFDIAREIRNDQRTAGIPVLMLSAINEKGVYAGTFSNRDRDDSWLPVNEFIEKPIRPGQLLEKVKVALEKGPLRR